MCGWELLELVIWVLAFWYGDTDERPFLWLLLILLIIAVVVVLFLALVPT